MVHVQMDEVLKRSSALADTSGKYARMRNLEDIKFVQGRSTSRTILALADAPSARHNSNAASAAEIRGGVGSDGGSEVSWEEANGYFNEGFSVVLAHADVRSAPLARFVEGVEAELGVPLRAHLQWTPAMSEGVCLCVCACVSHTWHEVCKQIYLRMGVCLCEGGGEHTGHFLESLAADRQGQPQRGDVGEENGGEGPREVGGDVFLLQLTGRQIVHVYQGARLETRETEADMFMTSGTPRNNLLYDPTVYQSRGGRGGVEGMVVGEELDDRYMFSTMVRK